MKKIIFYLALLLIGFFTTARGANASEGVVELENTVGSNERCFALSVETKQSYFQILVDCRDLTYPIETNGDRVYILWGTPASGEGNPKKLGELAYGKSSFTTTQVFSGLFVTTEPSRNVRNPSEARIMEGDIQAVSFLEREAGRSITRPKITPTPEEEQTTSPLSGIVRAIVTFIAVLLGIIIFAVIIFIIYRYKKSQS